MLDVKKMLQEAKSLVQLDEFDSGDVEFHLTRLADAINGETRLTEAGEHRFHVAGVYLLCNRLLLNRFLKEHEWLRDADVGNAIMIVGLPRTGSTKLQRLIAQDRRFDHLTLLDVALPLAFPGEQETEIRAPLVAAMERALGKPELIAGHNLTAAEPEEELELQKNHFTPRNMHDHVSIPKWMEAIKKLDARPKYHVVRQLIVANKVQRKREGVAWIFKNAYAGEEVDVIAEVFPNAKFVFTHRDPVEQLGSITSLGHKWRSFHSDVVTPEQSGREYLHFWSDFMDRTLVATDRVPADRVLHVRYKDIVKDPFDVIRSVYDFCSYELTSQVEQAMRDYDTQNVQHQHGKHDYALEDFGLSRALVEEAYSGYLEVHGDKV